MKKPPQIREVLSSQAIQINKKPSTPNLPPGHPAAAKLAATQAQPPSSLQPSPSQSQKSHAETNPDYVNVNLPSQFYWYPFKSLSLRTLQGLHIAKISRAEKESSLRHLVEAIGSTLEPGVSAYDLQPADFYFLMYWQRVNSFSKNPMLIEVLCNNEKHKDEVVLGVQGEDGEFLRDENNNVIKKDVSTLTIKEYLNKTTLDVKDYTPIDLSKFRDLAEYCGLGYETMRDVVDVTERIVEAEDGDPEYAFLAGKAAFIERRPGQESLASRIALVENMSPDVLQQLDEYIDAVSNFGVSESTIVRCKECGASTRVQISFDALTFLSRG